MQLSINTLVVLLVAAADTARATATIGAACSSPGAYDCSDDFDNIAVCNGRWFLAASCGSQRCVWPAGSPTPFCAQVKA
ncbi:hypothetical protein QBC34DRAFT_132159 [Podospora aff. communis PSN243]|uniref:Uncharacterized protein n=1 Tax=Podospora aff. communis PSN243 TaxID=3040156 RepID=A0AAV9GFV1_9PEZI|nr:hypothetical protein QBC34DRAFT_132159 [Podospora aff. communis PSN243]